jgi:hypothetical protein
VSTDPTTSVLPLGSTAYKEASPQTAVEHFRTAEMHATCARQHLGHGKRPSEMDSDRDERRVQFEGHTRLAEFHAQMAATLVAAAGLVGEQHNMSDRNEWGAFFTDRVQRRKDDTKRPESRVRGTMS